MKTIRLTGILILFLPFLLQAQYVDDGAMMCAHSKSKGHAHTHLQKSTQIGANHSFDVLHYKLDADFFHCFETPYPNSFDAVLLLRFKTDTTLNSIRLDAAQESLEIISLEGPVNSFRHEDDDLFIDLDQEYPAGDTLEILITYQHKEIDDKAFYAADGFVFTDCEPQRARRWFPCWDEPNDKATWELIAAVPDDVLLGSNGSLVDSTRFGDTLSYHWKSIHPLPTYLAVVSARKNWNLDILEWEKPDGSGSIPIRYYYNDGEDPSYIQGIYNDMSDYFSEIFGMYPFEKNGFATLNNKFPWGGMENQTLTSLCPNCWYESLIAHEFAHQWFGDLITCASWADLWLNEGFATYSEALWKEHTSGYEAYEELMISRKNNYMAGNPGRPIAMKHWNTTPPPQIVLFNYALTYAKSACVLYMLRKELGDAVFFDFIKSYGTDEDFMFKAITTEEFILKTNEFTGQDYRWFFEQWIYLPNHPIYQNIFYITQETENQWKVNFTTHQAQETAFFAYPIDIRFLGPELDSTIRIENTEDMQVWDFFFPSEVTEIQFDPEDKIFLKEVQQIVGMEETEMSKNIRLDPNPADKTVCLNITGAINQELIINIFDATGKVLYSEIRNPGGGINPKIDIPTHNLPQGFYLLSIESPTFALTKKLLIVH